MGVAVVEPENLNEFNAVPIGPPVPVRMKGQAPALGPTRQNEAPAQPATMTGHSGRGAAPQLVRSSKLGNR